MKSDSTSKTPIASASESSDNKEKVSRAKTSKLDENSSKIKLSKSNFFYHSFQPLKPSGNFEKLDQHGKLRNHWLTN